MSLWFLHVFVVFQLRPLFSTYVIICSYVQSITPQNCLLLVGPHCELPCTPYFLEPYFLVELSKHKKQNEYSGLEVALADCIPQMVGGGESFPFFSRMRSEGFSFNSWGSGGRALFATRCFYVRNRWQPSAVER